MTAAEFGESFEKCFACLFGEGGEFDEALRYACFGGGKRVRPVGVWLGASAVSPAPPLDEVMSLASAIELIHSYSLVHDDMPAMDNDQLRRGKPTVHVQYGEALAMLAGDALQTEAFSVLSGADAPAETVLRLVRTLSHASGFYGMAGGQALDLAMVGGHPTEAELLRMQTMKTGALIRAAVLMGAQAGDWTNLPDEGRSGLAVYSQALGLAFQVIDDILDCTQETAVLGKTAGKDEKDDKPTWVSILGLEGAKKKAEELRAEAQFGLDLVAKTEGLAPDATKRLGEIADYVLNRSF